MFATDEEKRASGRRLRQTRIALGYTSDREFASATGAEENTLTQWERGKALVPLRYVGRLKQRFSITADWIYFGDISGLPHGLAAKLDKRAA